MVTSELNIFQINDVNYSSLSRKSSHKEAKEAGKIFPQKIQTKFGRKEKVATAVGSIFRRQNHEGFSIKNLSAALLYSDEENFTLFVMQWIQPLIIM